MERQSAAIKDRPRWYYAYIETAIGWLCVNAMTCEYIDPVASEAINDNLLGTVNKISEPQ